MTITELLASESRLTRTNDTIKGYREAARLAIRNLAEGIGDRELAERYLRRLHDEAVRLDAAEKGIVLVVCVSCGLHVEDDGKPKCPICEGEKS